MMRMRPVTGFVLLGLLLLFTLLNLNYTEVNFLFIVRSVPVAFVIFFSAGLGAMSVLALKAFKTTRKEKKP